MFVWHSQHHCNPYQNVQFFHSVLRNLVLWKLQVHHRVNQLILLAERYWAWTGHVLVRQDFQWSGWDTNPATKPWTNNLSCMQDVLVSGVSWDPSQERKPTPDTTCRAKKQRRDILETYDSSKYYFPSPQKFLKYFLILFWYVHKHEPSIIIIRETSSSI